MSIRTKISLLVIPLVLLPLCIVGFFSYQSLSRGFQEQSYLADQQLSLTVSAKIEQLLDECYNNLLLASSILSNQMVLSGEKSLETFFNEHDNPIEELATGLSTRFSPYLKIRIINPYGKELFVVQTGKEAFEPGSALDEDIFLKSVSVSGQFPPVQKESGGSWVTTFTRSLVYDRNLMGLVYFDLDMDAIGKLLRDIAVSRPGYYYLFDGSGKILAESGAFPFVKNSPTEENIQATIRNTLENQWHVFTHYPGRIDDRRVFYSVQPIREYISFRDPLPQERWYLGIVHIDPPLIAAFRQSIKLFWVVLSIGVILAFVGTFYISGAITTPIRRLTETTREYARGNLESQVAVTSSDEIGRLARAFNSMASEIKNLMKERRANETLIAIGRFSAALAHDLRNPVEGMKLLAGELKKQAGTSEPEREIADTIAQSVDNLSTFINQSLDFARLTEPDFEKANLAYLAEDILKDFRYDDVEIKREYTYDLPSVEIDVVQIKRVMSNLIANALDACRQKVSTLECHIIFRIYRLNETIHIEVADNGVGIHPEALDKIFDPFYSTKPDGPGLGLSLVRQIIHNHSGTVTVKSEFNRGTHFIVEIPMQKKHNG